MPALLGNRAELGIGKETTRATAVAPSYWIRRDDLTLDEKIMQAVDESTRGIIEDSVDAVKIGELAEGEISSIVRDQSFGLWLLATFGTVASAVKGGETVVFEHTFTVQQGNQHQSLTLHLKTPNSAKDFALSVIDTFELNVELERHAYFTVGVKSKKGATATRTPSYIAENIFLPQHGVFKTAAALTGLDAAAAVNIKKFTLSIEKNIEEDRIIGNLAPNDILNKSLAVSGSVELLYTSESFIDDLLNDTARAMRLDLINTGVTIGTASNPKLRIDLAKVKFTEVARSFDKGDLVRLTASFKGHYSDSDALLIRSILTNTVSSY